MQRIDIRIENIVLKEVEDRKRTRVSMRGASFVVTKSDHETRADGNLTRARP